MEPIIPYQQSSCMNLLQLFETPAQQAGPSSIGQYAVGQSSSAQYEAGFSQGPVLHSNDDEQLEDYELPDFDVEDDMDVWNEAANEIRVGMYFKSKDEEVRPSPLGFVMMHVRPHEVCEPCKVRLIHEGAADEKGLAQSRFVTLGSVLMAHERQGFGPFVRFAISSPGPGSVHRREGFGYVLCQEGFG
ncbi:hypothetical protein R6Q59_031243 [Mikania micrantha]